MELIVENALQTQAFAENLATFLEPNDVILLDGDLGAGKTTFTQGLARGLAIKRNVKSPTFNLIKEYHDGTMPLYHMDLYRLEGIGGEDLGLEEYFNGDGVCVVEWGKFVADDLPPEYLTIQLKKDLNDFEKRTLVLLAQGQHYENLIQKLQ
ncbi:tRNA (adenosine(37)-N6)-threonylcarbamoyltransferase complex ATPase subunit type 1 TsaE [Ligilactobacillus ceti]|uniref:tRNA threonylcarbamoyladenosine biosynthesis protein TsaE n=1 Tax=Ligilactobacillus ceti DSM 22408 TaxID=1122146 RepID=A0A0R2KKT4_9LACO|nr:tRNA (adenosine(37)-N6)-threonylcarbamoyltransferase complex ATPase subunit type 1 TsaE [Ligilactobacillus ceti]KRN90000.1 ATP GTP hydrolase [Ligilactobacillus ceti DSM 22408]